MIRKFGFLKSKRCGFAFGSKKTLSFLWVRKTLFSFGCASLWVRKLLKKVFVLCMDEKGAI